MAKNELARQKPAAGDRIAIKYFGRTDDDRGYERYRILVETSNNKSVDWDAIGAEARSELAGKLPDKPEIMSGLPMPGDDAS